MKDTKKTVKKPRKATKSVEKKVGDKTIKIEYTTELEKNLKEVHGLDAKTELKKVLEKEVVIEQERAKTVTLWIKRKTTPGQADSTWKIRGMFTSKKEAEKAFEKLNGTSDLYEHKFE